VLGYLSLVLSELGWHESQWARDAQKPVPLIPKCFLLNQVGKGHREEPTSLVHLEKYR